MVYCMGITNLGEKAKVLHLGFNNGKAFYHMQGRPYTVIDETIYLALQ